MGKPFVPNESEAERQHERRETRFSATCHGFDVHCAVRIAAEDDEGRERLIRYCARPPFALERIEEMKDGRISYLMKTPRRGSTHRVMTPVEFMARLAILVPPPYFPLVPYHGVFAARSLWRALVTPKPPDGLARPNKSSPCREAETVALAPALPSPSPPPASSAPSPGAPPMDRTQTRRTLCHHGRSNYLGQSVILGFIFYGYGLGLFGRLGPAAALLLGLALYLAQILMSAAWLRRFRFGPVEWAWRSFTYGALQPMRLGGAR